MTSSRSTRVKFAAVAVALAALGTVSAAQAHTFFSVSGVLAPGVAVGVTNVPTPVYVQPSPVYTQPAVVYPNNSTEVWFPGTVQYAPPVVEYVRPAWGRRWDHDRRWRDHERWEHERWERERHWEHDRD